SPRKPSVATVGRSSARASLLVAWRAKATSASSAAMPSPSSRTAISSSPPAASRTSTWWAPASSAFSTSSFTTEAGRSITRPAALGERQLGRLVLGVEQLAERVAAEIADPFQVLVGRRQVDHHAVVLDAREEDHLVARARHVELELRVLVGGAERAHGRLAPLDGAAGEVLRLAEALRPELAEPVGGRRQALAVRHEDDDRLRVRAGQEEEHPRQCQRRVGER